MASNKRKRVPGMRVRFTSQALHDLDPRYYPAVGTVGEVRFRGLTVDSWFVQWPDGATMGNGLWSAPKDALEVIDDGHQEAALNGKGAER